MPARPMSDRQEDPQGRGALWDAWSAARRLDPELTPRAFLERRGPLVPTELDELELMVALERDSPPSSLVDAVARDPRTGYIRFAGHVLLETLGQGSSGIVYLARPADAGPEAPRVALKILNPLLAATPARRDSILLEAEIARALDHPSILRVLSSGVERGYAWIAAEYVEGETLERLLAAPREPAARHALALTIGLQLAAALGHAHARGVVHRDLKPSNLVLTPDGRVKLLDFGLARTQGTAFSVSRTGETVGTPLYMSPEQARGSGEVGPWTDVYAVGLLLYEIASGERIDSEEALHVLLARIAKGRVGIGRARLAALQPGLRAVVRRCIEAHPRDRYQSCAQLAADLEDVREGRAPRVGALSALARWWRRVKRHPARVAGVVVAAGLLAWCGWYAWWTWPVPVVLGTVSGGKRIWIDGVESSSWTARSSLRPGKHLWRAQFPSDAYVFEGVFEVQPRTPWREVLFLSPWYGALSTALPGIDVPTGPGQFAFVVIATPGAQSSTIELEVDGHRAPAAPRLSTFSIPLGRHRILASSPGMRTRVFDVDLETQELCFLPFEFDPVDSPWETQVLYSPVDYAVQHGTEKIRDLRLYCEEMQMNHLVSTTTFKPYWCPTKSFQEGTVLFAVNLGRSVEQLELEFLHGPAAVQPGSYEVCSIGPEEDDLHVVFEARDGKTIPDTVPYEKEIPGNNFCVPSALQLAAATAAMRGHDTMFVRWAVGGVAAGEEGSHAFAMRSNALPTWLGGELIWCPAMRIRTRTKP